MLKTIIDKEIERIEGLGFSCIVGNENIAIDSSVHQLSIGNDSYIFTGINLSETDIIENRTKVSIISATNSISGTQQQIGNAGVVTFKLMHEYIIVKSSTNSGEIAPFSLQFVKISPIKK